MKSEKPKRQRRTASKPVAQKKKPKAIPAKTGRRGRKPGGGVLRGIDALDYQAATGKLLFGRAYDDPVAQRVIKGRFLAAQVASYSAFIESVPAGEREYAARHAIRRKERYEKTLQAYYEIFGREAVEALAAGNTDWFTELAGAIESVKLAPEHTRFFPLHLALMHLNEDYWPCSIRLTLRAACDLLEKQGLRVSGQSDCDWHRRVRHVAKHDLRMQFLPDKPGRKRNRP